MDAIDPNAVYVGGVETSRWNDLNPSEIENIEIIKGPAAAALYGTAAASGVVIVTTKRGRTGDARWSAHVEYGGSALDADFPANFQQIGRNPAGARVGSCNLDLRSRGLCTPMPDSLLSYNPVASANPFRDGDRQTVGLRVMGGSGGSATSLAAKRSRSRACSTPTPSRASPSAATWTGA
jgi:TonB-dependent SusC/RagA subfamily outer membrane receptor